MGLVRVPDILQGCVHVLGYAEHSEIPPITFFLDLTTSSLQSSSNKLHSVAEATQIV
jgi:hypothetical protein